MTLRYAYFPGCSATGSCRELDRSTRAVAAALGIRLEELESPGCTGAREFRAISERLHLTANGRILALAEAKGCDLAVVCDTCLLNLVEANGRLRADARAREDVNRLLAESGLAWRGTVTVKHFLWVLLGDLGAERLRARVVRPLAGLRVAPFYGCHLLRPAAAHGSAAADGVASLERLCEVLGAEPVPYEGATGCCGFHVVVAEERIALRMSGRHLARAKDGGAHCLVTPCPLCHTVLDAYQPGIERELRRPLGLPVLHVAQLVGLAIGMSPGALGISRHVVDATDALRRVAG